MSWEIATECPCLTTENFEFHLSNDETLVHFFNHFLSLPSFPESLLYNQDTGLFEVVTDAAECVSREIRSLLLHSRSLLFTTDRNSPASRPQIDNSYSVSNLEKEQGMQWVLTERVPLFIQSDCYFEYRLAKVLSQWDFNPWARWRGNSSCQDTHTRITRPLSTSLVNNNNVPKAPMCSDEKVSVEKGKGTSRSSISEQQQRTKVKPAGCISAECVSCSPSTEDPDILFPTQFSSSSSSSSSVNSENVLEPQSPQRKLALTESENGPAEEQIHENNNSQNPDGALDHLAARVVDQVIRDVVTQMKGSSQAHTENHTENLHHSTTDSCSGSANNERVEEKSDRESGAGEGDQGKDQGNNLDIYHSTCFHGSRHGLVEFKEFLQGTLGEQLFHLWMDIERLKVTHDEERKHRHLVQMRGRYLLSSSHSCLDVVLLARLGLTTPPCWTEEKLHLIQPSLTEALLYYWAPRFWTSRLYQQDTSPLDPWTDRHLRPLSGIDPSPRCIAQNLLRCQTSLPGPYPSRPSSVGSPALGSRGMERMLQALYVDAQAGFYFTQFCERSGNKLWQSAVYFWSDLQLYYQLFYLDALDPYRIQRQAQLLYFTYLCSSARRPVGVKEEIRREVYGTLKPAFEGLFDEVEEHILTLLLDPWTLLISTDQESYDQVCLEEEVRQVDSEEYRELQSLYAESEYRWKQKMEQSVSSPSVSSPHSPENPSLWSAVPPSYHGYRLGSLLRHPQEFRHFQAFLQRNDASAYLTCWLDLEQYRRTPQRNKADRQEKSCDIKDKYLSWKFFFGPNSPATKEQQEDIMRLLGGPERLKYGLLSNAAVVEIQDVVRSYIEKTWLPRFLSSPGFIERQQHKLQVKDRLSEQHGRQQRRRREAWKRTEGLWMSSSKEILVLRRVLLNPVTCQQFQTFVSLEGDFLENDVLFWLEVQRYKNLYHSHSDEATIQRKVSTIINCFINSSTPPALQIDIPPEQAQNILENRRDLGPYIFREAQMSVFSELLKLWPQFEALRSSEKEEHFLALLEKKRDKLRARQQRRRRKEEEEEEEERRAQEEAERLMSNDVEEDEVDIIGVNRRTKSGGEESRLIRSHSSVLYSPKQQISWSYSKCMEALRREEVLLRRQTQMEASFSTVSGSSSSRSLKSAASRRSQRLSSALSPRTDHVQPI